MRIWSIHPQYLDTKGIVAVWRETLLARKVLLGLTKGYTNHPQLQRFRTSGAPIEYIDIYLKGIYSESLNRNYNFDKTKFNPVKDEEKYKISVTTGQIEYEWIHLLRKLKDRDSDKYDSLKDLAIKDVKLHPIFYPIEGDIESWEIIIPNIQKEILGVQKENKIPIDIDNVGLIGQLDIDKTDTQVGDISNIAPKTEKRRKQVETNVKTKRRIQHEGTENESRKKTNNRK